MKVVQMLAKVGSNVLGPGGRFARSRPWMMLACCMSADPVVLPNSEIQEICIQMEAPELVMSSPKILTQEEASTFTVVVPTKNFATLGLQLDLTDARAPMILRIEEGAVQEFNKVYKDSGILPFDVLLALDGTKRWEGIQKKMTSKLPEKMFLTLKRPRKIQVSVEKTGNMGMTLASTDKSAGVVIQDLDCSGQMAKWNAKRKSHSHDALEVLDRIIEVDGKAYCGTELANLLEQKRIWHLTVLKYTQGEGAMPVWEGLSRRTF